MKLDLTIDQDKRTVELPEAVFRWRSDKEIVWQIKREPSDSEAMKAEIVWVPTPYSRGDSGSPVTLSPDDPTPADVLREEANQIRGFVREAADATPGASYAYLVRLVDPATGETTVLDCFAAIRGLPGVKTRVMLGGGEKPSI